MLICGAAWDGPASHQIASTAADAIAVLKLHVWRLTTTSILFARVAYSVVHRLSRCQPHSGSVHMQVSPESGEARARRARATGKKPLACALRRLLRIEPLGRELGALRQRLELGPGDLRVHAAAQPAIRRGNHVLGPDRLSEPADAIGDKLRMLDQVGR